MIDSGTVYHKKHSACFTHNCPQSSPNSITSVNPKSQHHQWLDIFRSTVWDRIEFEDQLPPSWEALWRHWIHSCRVADLWGQVFHNLCHLLFGWKIENGNLEVDWNAPNNVAEVRSRVDLFAQRLLL